MTPLLGFTPDADPVTPGVMTDCLNVVPYETGFKGAPSAVGVGVSAMASACQGAAVVTKLDGTRRIIAGTAAKLYELPASTWTDVSKVGDYAGGSDSRWSICQYGDSTIAANGVDTIQRSTSGAFASISGAPIAKIVFSVGAFVMALNTNDGTVKQDGWHNCASFDDTDWTPNVATLANSGRLVSTPGPITAGGRLGEFAVAYKKRAIYVGQFVGAPASWDWVQVPGGSAGCVGQDAWCDINGAHFFVGEDALWMFEGSRPVPIGDGQVRQWFYNNCNQTFLYRTQCVYDEQNNVVWVFYPSKTAERPDTALVFHVLTKQWGKVDVDVQAVLNFVQAGATFDTLDTFGASFDALPSVSFDSQYWLAGGRSLAVFDASNTIKSLTGEALSGTFTTGDLGDDEQVTSLKRLRIRFQQNPTSATVQTLGKMNQGDAFTAKPTATMTNGQFDVRQSARFHRASFTVNGDCKFNAIRPTITPSGER